MNVMVCVKIEADLSMLAASDWQSVAEGEREVTYARRQLSGFDQSAAEMALSLSGHDLTLMTVGNALIQPVLKTLLALDFARAVRIETQNNDLRFHPGIIAAQIASYHAEHPQSVIILGSQSSEGQNRQTGFLLAEMLGWPCLTEVSEIQATSDTGFLTVQRRTEDELQTLTLKPPVVLITGAGAQAQLLRIPTLKQKLAAAAKPLEMIPAIGLPDNPGVRLSELTLKETGRAGVMIEGGSVQESVRELYQQHLAQRWHR
ncbi:hypothetical protein GE278_06550 [Enterobacteriaceae bacterium Kacie_13]|nr:hypothetical protein GE278_06550 [Enterobacteriaceae bacterium Kacie_13]